MQQAFGFTIPSGTAPTRTRLRESSSARSDRRKRCGPLITRARAETRLERREAESTQNQSLELAHLHEIALPSWEREMRIVALILKRLAWLVPTLARLVAIDFFISRVIPSDPVALRAGETASLAQIELLRQKLGLDRPLIVQLLDYYRQLLSGDLGTSLFTTRPVWDDLSARLP